MDGKMFEVWNGHGFRATHRRFASCEEAVRWIEKEAKPICASMCGGGRPCASHEVRAASADNDYAAVAKYIAANETAFDEGARAARNGVPAKTGCPHKCAERCGFWQAGHRSVTENGR